MNKTDILLMLGTSFNTKGGISTVVKNYRDADLFDKFSVKYVETHIDGNSIQKLIRALIGLCAFSYYLAFYNVKLVHIHVSSRASFWRKSIYFVLCKIFRKKTIFHLHGSEFREFYDEELSKVGRWIASKVINSSTLVITLSHSWSTWIIERFPEKEVKCIYNSINAVPKLENCSKQDSKIELLFLGRIGKRKGAFDILEALASPEFKRLKFTFSIGGDGEVSEFLRYADSLGLKDEVNYLGWVNDEEKVRRLNSSDIFLLPSYNEGMPMSILEALSAGIPVVASDVGGIPHQVSDGKEGFLVKPGDVESLKTALYKLMTSEDLRSKMSKQCTKKFEDTFSTAAVLPNLESIYKELLER